MGIILFILFVAMEIVLTVLNCTKCTKKIVSTRNKAICWGIEFTVMLFVILFPASNQKFRFLGCLIVLGTRLFIAIMSYVWCIIKHKAIGKPEPQISGIGSVIACAANAILIFCFVFPSIVFPGFKEIENNSEKRTEVMQKIFTENNDNKDTLSSIFNTVIYEFVVSD